MEKTICTEIAATTGSPIVQKIATVMKLLNIQEIEFHIREKENGGYAAEFIDLDETNSILEGYLETWFNSVSWDEYLEDCFDEDDCLGGELKFHDADFMAVTIQYSINDNKSNYIKETIKAGTDYLTGDELDLLLSLLKEKKIQHGNGVFSGGGDSGGIDELSYFNKAKKEVTPNDSSLESHLEDLIYNVAGVGSFNGEPFINGDFTFRANKTFTSITVSVETTSSYSESQTIELRLDIKKGELNLEDS